MIRSEASFFCHSERSGAESRNLYPLPSPRPTARSTPKRKKRHRACGAIIARVNLRISYETVYRYAEPVQFSPHDLRIIPRSDAFVQLRALKFDTQPEATLRFSHDVFDNQIASLFFSGASETLAVRMNADVELAKKNPFDFILAAEAVELPFTSRRESAALFAGRRSRGAIALPNWRAPTTSARRGTVETLVELTRAIHGCIDYERREEGPARSPRETLRRGRGACRDVAVLLAEILRSLGLAARIVSGYLREADEAIHRAERSLHAWAEVFLPGAGWVGLDPTNGIFCDDNFIAAAVGLQPAHVTPISGSFYHQQNIAAEMTSRVELINLDSGDVE